MSRASRELASPDAPEPGTPLYVHVPFCAAKCPYCDFYSFAAEEADADGFVSVLLEEAARRAPRDPDTVFVGGGTPSWLSGADLRALLDGLDRLTGFRRSAAEVTVECNPESLDRAQADRLAELGATRLSIGVQSLRPELLETFGRVHGPREAFDAFHAARAAGFADLNVDLIYAAPGQRLEDWEEDLARILDWGPTHVSAYHLTFEPGTAFERWRAEGRLHAQPETAQLAFFERTHERLAAAGLAAYEVSNFSLDGRHCRHNVNYWENGPYVGLGPSAVSRVGRRRFGNARSLGTWRDDVAGGDGPAWSESLSLRARLGETWWLGLRTTRGVSPALARETSGFAETADPCLAMARDLARRGLLEVRDGRFALTASGLPLADAVAAEFLEPDPEAEPARVGEGGPAR
jgi:oxygen-independent coproporphyrinogen-3 oxidase